MIVMNKFFLKGLLGLVLFVFANFAYGNDVAFTIPPNDSVVVGDTVRIEWEQANALEYYIAVGDSPYSGNYFETSNGTNNFVEVGGLPEDESTVYVTLYSTFSGETEGTYDVIESHMAFLSSPVSDAVNFIEPINDSVVVGDTVRIEWVQQANALEYQIGTGDEPYSATYSWNNAGTSNFVEINGLPEDGTTVYVTLYSTFPGETEGTYDVIEYHMAFLSEQGDTNNDTSFQQGLITSQYFGIHLHDPDIELPPEELNMGSIRLWDTDGSGGDAVASQWAGVMPTRNGNPQWGALEQHLSRAETAGMDIVYNLGGTPKWASSRGEDNALPSPYGDSFIGFSDMPDLDDWKDWVRMVAERYNGRIKYWEIWNEPGLISPDYPEGMFFNGSMDDLIILSQTAYNILKEVNPENQVVSPGFVTYDGERGFKQFIEAGGGEYADIVGFHFYQNYDNGEFLPEQLYLESIPNIKETMQLNGINKPLWNTEAGSPEPEEDVSGFELPSDAARMSRWLLLNWASGVERFFFYAWDEKSSDDTPDVYLVEDHDTSNSNLTPAGQAYKEVSSWMLNKSITYMDRQDFEAGIGHAVWVVQLMAEDDTPSFVVWSPYYNNRNFFIPEAWGIQSYKSLDGEVTNIENNQILIGKEPVLLQ